MSEFDFDVVHRPGISHGNAEALSRRPSSNEEITVATVKNNCPGVNAANWQIPVGKSMEEEQKNDSLLSQLHEWKDQSEPALIELVVADEATKKLWFIKKQIIRVENVLYRERETERETRWSAASVDAKSTASRIRQNVSYWDDWRPFGSTSYTRTG